MGLSKAHANHEIAAETAILGVSRPGRAAGGSPGPKRANRRGWTRASMFRAVAVYVTAPSTLRLREACPPREPGAPPPMPGAE